MIINMTCINGAKLTRTHDARIEGIAFMLDSFVATAISEWKFYKKDKIRLFRLNINERATVEQMRIRLFTKLIDRNAKAVDCDFDVNEITQKYKENKEWKPDDFRGMEKIKNEELKTKLFQLYSKQATRIGKAFNSVN